MTLFSAKKPLKRNVTWRYEGPVLADFGHQIARTYECPDLFQVDGVTVAVGALMHYRDKQGRFQQVRWYAGDLVNTDNGRNWMSRPATGAISAPDITPRKASPTITAVASYSAGIPTSRRCVLSSRALPTA